MMTGLYNNDIDFVNKLTEIVNSNLANESFGINDLSEQIGISHSQIHRKLKFIKNQSISQFIKELRLKKAQELLEKNNLTGSEIAYEVGFGSPSYFNKCYHDYYGYPPGEQVNHIHKDTKKETETTVVMDKLPTSNLGITIKRNSKINYLLVSILLLLIIMFAFYYIKEEGFALSQHHIKSIAVLTLKNLTNNPEDQYLANGIMYDIQNRLSHFNDLEVKSYIIPESYNTKNKTVPEIAKDLKVSYVLEGSLLKYNERIRIYIHLIDTRANVVWSDQYDHDFSNMFAFVSDVSKNTVQNLLPSLQVDEIQQVDNQLKVNEKAYRLYLEGRFYYRLRTADGFNRSIALYNQALEVDSNYALAYAGLGDSYLTATWAGYFPVNEGIPKCRMYLDKASSLNPDLAEVHTSYGGLATYFDSDYAEAEKHLKRALQINPGYDRANKIFAEYFDVTGNKEGARKYIDKAHFLNPTYPEIIALSCEYYSRDGDYANALSESLKLYNLNKDEKSYLNRCLLIYLQEHNDSLSYTTYKKLNELDNSPYTAKEIDAAYHQANINGILQLMINARLKENTDLQKRHKEFDLAKLYTLIGDKKSAVEYLEKSYLKNPGPVHRVNYYTLYTPLKSEPKFQALMKKMHQGDY